MDVLAGLLPELGAREAWVVGTVIVFALLRPVGRPGWAAAGAMVVAAAASVAAAPDVVAGEPAAASGETAATVAPLIAALAWLLLAVVLAGTAVSRPLRWEPRTGPGAATALLAGVAVVHAGAAWHGGGRLGALGDAWADGRLVASALEGTSAGPLSWVLAWLPGAVPGVSPRLGAALLGLVAVAVTVLGAERLGRRWGHVGTARCTAAAVAWSPPLVLAHRAAPAELLATAALVASWWALVEVWGGRHRAGRLAVASGALLGVAVGVSLWPVVVLPLWARRLGVRTVGWFVAGLLTAVLAGMGVLAATQVTLADVWRTSVTGLLADASVPAALAVGVAVAAVAAASLHRPLSPTRLSSVSATVLLTTVPWWPAAAPLVGPVAALPFVLLAAVAPDLPGERWPPDAALPSDRTEVAA